jgi:hypothetical protein
MNGRYKTTSGPRGRQLGGLRDQVDYFRMASSLIHSEYCPPVARISSTRDRLLSLVPKFGEPVLDYMDHPLGAHLLGQEDPLTVG